MNKALKQIVVFLSAIMIVTNYLSLAIAAQLLVDDFEDGEKPNMLRGDFGSWDKDPADLTQGCKMSFYTEIDGNVCLMLKYDVDSPNPAYNGFWMFLQGQNLKGYEKLHLSLKGDKQAGFTNRIKLELKNDKKEVGKFILAGIKDYWQDFNTPLTNFYGLTDWSKITEFVIVFDDINSTIKDGMIYLDNIYFE